MKKEIEQLTDEKAQRALLSFYELLPEKLWQGTKPTFGDLEYWREEIEDAATPEIQPFLDAIQDESNSSARGDTARALLIHFTDYEPLQPYVSQAVSEAQKPEMVALPEIIMAASIILAAMPSQITWTNSAGKTVSIQFDQLKNASAFISSITGFIKEAKGLPWFKKSG